MSKYSDETELFNRIEKKLYTAVISDVMDEMGFMHQAMREDIRPLFPEAIITGRAMTVLAIDVFEKKEDPYKYEIASVDSLKKNDVLVAYTNKSTRTGFWGELLSTASRARGARGAIIDGYTRDVRKIIEMKFPVFVTGIKPVDSKGRSLVIDYNCPVECGDILVNPGDFIFADIDGVVVIPRNIVDEVIKRAFEKVNKENLTREDLKKGAFLKDVYKKYGVL
jgi:regulator of RNase E activity RraA